MLKWGWGGRTPVTLRKREWWSCGCIGTVKGNCCHSVLSLYCSHTLRFSLDLLQCQGQGRLPVSGEENIFFFRMAELLNVCSLLGWVGVDLFNTEDILFFLFLCNCEFGKWWTWSLCEPLHWLICVPHTTVHCGGTCLCQDALDSPHISYFQHAGKRCREKIASTQISQSAWRCKWSKVFKLRLKPSSIKLCTYM